MGDVGHTERVLTREIRMVDEEMADVSNYAASLCSGGSNEVAS